MTRKNVRRLELVFRRRRTTEARDEWKLALGQSRRMSRSKSSAYWKTRISDAGPDARSTWKSVNTLLGEDKTSAKADFNAQEYLNYIEKKVDGIREATASSAPPEFTNCGHFNLTTFEIVCVDDIRLHIAAAPSKKLCASSWTDGAYQEMRRCSGAVHYRYL